MKAKKLGIGTFDVYEIDFGEREIPNKVAYFKINKKDGGKEEGWVYLDDAHNHFDIRNFGTSVRKIEHYALEKLIKKNKNE